MTDGLLLRGGEGELMGVRAGTGRSVPPPAAGLRFGLTGCPHAPDRRHHW
ncbi:hypothetical protein [Catellatospora sp. TT07R-123]|nr:hypothetical protein [Catellatospora sp. TT07R-123]